MVPELEKGLCLRKTSSNLDAAKLPCYFTSHFLIHKVSILV